MTVEQFRQFHARRPFEPFVIHLADQRFFGIRDPDAVTPSLSGRTATLLNADGKLEVIDMLLVTSIRPYTELESRAGFPIKG